MMYETLEISSDVSKRDGRVGIGWYIRGMDGLDTEILDCDGREIHRNCTSHEGEWIAMFHAVQEAQRWDSHTAVLLTDCGVIADYINNPAMGKANQPPHVRWVTQIRDLLFEYDDWRAMEIPRTSNGSAHKASRRACPTVGVRN